VITILSRSVLFETARLTVFYGAAYLALVSIAVGAPLVRSGAPLLDVVLFLPNQLAFPATLAIPLALVTATLACLARMREDGEITALKAAGVSGIRIALSNLPLMIVTALLVAWLAHLVLPVAFENFTRGKASLLRQAMATKVARQEPIFQDSDRFGLNQTSLAAATASGNRLGHVFAWRFNEEGRLWLGYAPQAIWSIESETRTSDVAGKTVEEEISSLKLNLVDLRFLHHTQEPPPIPEEFIEQGLDVRETEDFDIPYPAVAGFATNWRVSLDRDALQNYEPAETKATARLAEEISRIKENIHEFEGSDLVNRMPPHLKEELLEKTMKYLVSHQLAWHMRWMLPFAVFAYWLIASGLALTIPARSRMVAVFVGIATVIGTVMPALATIKGMGGQLPREPDYMLCGLILWTPPATMAVAGAWLLWKRR